MHKVYMVNIARYLIELDKQTTFANVNLLYLNNGIKIYMCCYIVCMRIDMNITYSGGIWSMLFLDHPEAVDDDATLIIGHLLKVQMAGIVRLEPQIAKVLAVKGAPRWHFLEEWLTAFMIARSAGDDVHRCTRIHIRLR